MAEKKPRKSRKKEKAEVAHAHKKKSINYFTVNNILVVLLVFAVMGLVYLYVSSNKPGPDNGGVNGTQNGSQNQGTGQYGTVKLDFYVMSQCPYGVQVENGIYPVLKTLGNSVKFSLNYIANENPDGTFSSLHGQNEVAGNIVQLCAMKYSPDKYMDLIFCQNKNVGDVANNWRSCAAESGIDAAKLESCSTGAEGKNLLSDSIKASEAVNAQGSPTMYLDGVLYQGPRDSVSFTRALCAKLNGHPACANLPACASDADCTAVSNKDGKCVNPGESNAKCEYSDPVPINLIVLNAKECTSCDTSRILEVTKQLFLGVKIRTVEYNSTEGKALAEKYGVKILPAYLFDSNITKSPSYEQVSRALVKADDMYMIHPQAAGSSYNPNLVEIPNKLDLFVMSQCPYGVQAEQNLKSVLKLFGNRINFTLRFIANKNTDGSFSSLHGQPEVDEDLRQVCAVKYNPDKYYDYIICIDEDYRNAATKWESCAQSAGLNVDAIKACSTGDEGKELLTENIKLTDELGIGSSPTFLINGKQQVGGALPANSIKEAICKANAGLEGCGTTLETASGSTNSAAAAAGSCG